MAEILTAFIPPKPAPDFKPRVSPANNDPILCPYAKSAEDAKEILKRRAHAPVWTFYWKKEPENVRLFLPCCNVMPGKLNLSHFVFKDGTVKGSFKCLMSDFDFCQKYFNARPEDKHLFAGHFHDFIRLEGWEKDWPLIP